MDWYPICRSNLAFTGIVGMNPDQVKRVIAGWGGGRAPLYRQLADALTAAIERGEVPAGSWLPPERRLAAAPSTCLRSEPCWKGSRAGAPW
jgi:hypothetical protein